MGMGNGDDKPRQVRAMFEAIAGRYDFLNHFLSANLDRGWRRACVRAVGRRLPADDAPRILDVGCGTGDLSLAFSRVGAVTGCDFSREMLRRGARKVADAAPRLPVQLLEADALRLPFADEAFDVAVSAFVLRNLADIDRGLGEMWRVLRQGGVLGVLDFGMPRTPVLRRLYGFYFLRVLPRVGRWVSGADGPYQYLPDSVQTFPPAEELRRRVEAAGFRDVRIQRLAGGVTVLITAEKRAGGAADR
ncbi:MAG: ubiquinone/menaquinone biosynthesis methyltransferase [Acidobacteriota bacterium]|jgi:demethylmenaquinone methyltransferase/2-methoxy-6-polyprenyl-1,4-benzoquinol methylase|nr:ubiquinone/menaquinone biosynthesis methyltransferase [Acidobacteriota bacterium]